MITASAITGSLLEKVSCNDLKPGMYVQELDRPWLETPFLFQGFCIQTNDEIDTLKKYCDFVMVNRDEELPESAFKFTHSTSRTYTTSDIRAIASRSGAVGLYSDTTIVEEELATARTIYQESEQIIETVFSAAHRECSIDLQETRKTTSSIVDSVLRNPDAFMLLQRIRNKNQYKYTHAMNCCALAATFCRHLGYSKTEIREIALGALLLDIGITRVPDSMINTHKSLNTVSMKLVRHHVNFGIEILDNTPNLPAIARDMVRTHHERVNGKGYPEGLSGDQIPVCGRIAAIVDCYDAMISNRPHKKNISPTDAVCTMYNWRNKDFHEDLMEQFIQCIGAYPTGSLVELSSGQIGIVMSQNRVRRLYPRILLIMNAEQAVYERPQTIDLWEFNQKTLGDSLEISNIVDAEQLGIDPADYYL